MWTSVTGVARFGDRQKIARANMPLYSMPSVSQPFLFNYRTIKTFKNRKRQDN